MPGWNASTGPLHCCTLPPCWKKVPAISFGGRASFCNGALSSTQVKLQFIWTRADAGRPNPGGLTVDVCCAKPSPVKMSFIGSVAEPADVAAVVAAFGVVVSAWAAVVDTQSTLTVTMRARCRISPILASGGKASNNQPDGLMFARTVAVVHELDESQGQVSGANRGRKGAVGGSRSDQNRARRVDVGCSRETEQ